MAMVLLRMQWVGMAVVVWGGVAAAQEFRHEVWGRAVYGDGYVYGPTTRAEAVEVVDFDADGDMDFVLPPVDGTIDVVRNLGSSSAFFAGGPRSLNVEAPGGDAQLDYFTAFADVTGDGLPELFAQAVNYTTAESRIVWYENTGPRDNPAYVLRGTVYTSGQTSYPLGPMKVADLNGDGLEDLFFLEFFLNGAGPHHRLFVIANSGTEDMPNWGTPAEIADLSELMPPRYEITAKADKMAIGAVLPPGKSVTYVSRVTDFDIADWDVDGDLDFMFYDGLHGVDWVRNMGTPTDPVWEGVLNGNGVPPYRHAESLGALRAAFGARPAPTPRSVGSGILFPDFYAALNGRIYTFRYNLESSVYDLFHTAALGFYFGFGPSAFWDADGDGDLDLFAAADLGNGQSQLTIVPNEGTPYQAVWSDDYIVPTRQLVYDLRMSIGTQANWFRQDQFVFDDINRDGVMDFFVQNQNGTITKYAVSQAGAPFDLPNFYSPITNYGNVVAAGDVPLEPRGLAVANFDALEGYPQSQIITAYAFSGGARLIYSDPLYDGWRDLSDALPDPSGSGTLNPDLIESLAAADLDGDGRADLIVSLSEQIQYTHCTHHIYRNIPDTVPNDGAFFQFEYAGQILETEATDDFAARMVSVADLDADGDMDLFVNHHWYSSSLNRRFPWLRFYRNAADTLLDFWRTRVVSGQTWTFTVGGQPASFQFVSNASGGSLFGNSYTAGPTNRVVDIIETTGLSQNYRVFIDVLPPVGDESKAILVLGSTTDDPLYPVFSYLAGYAYSVLTTSGMAPENVRLLAPSAIDGDGDGISDTYAAPTLDNLEAALTQWAPGTERLFVYLLDHGQRNRFRMNEIEYLEASDYAAWLNALQAGGAPAVTTLIDTCEAGTFIGHLIMPKALAKSGATRVTMTSAGVGPLEGLALFDPTVGASFSLAFWSEIYNGGSYGRAYDAARVFIQAINPLQSPQLDDNGNGVANEAGDGAVARQLQPGAAFAQPDTGVYVGDVAPIQALNSNSTTLWLSDVVSNFPVESSGALVVRPNFNRGVSESADEQPITGLDFVGFDANPTLSRYEGTYSQFNEGGLYRILYFVEAGGRFHMSPRVGYVDRVGLPDFWEPDNSFADAQWIPVNNVQGHNFHAQGDTDWVRFISPPSGTATIAVLSQGPSCQPDVALFEASALANDAGAPPVREAAAPAPGQSVRFEYTFSGSKEYVLRIRNADPNDFGAGTSYLLLVAVGTGGVIPPVLVVTVVDGATQQPLGAATVVAGQGGGADFTARTTADGVAQFTCVADQSYTIRAEKPGYAVATQVVSVRKQLEPATVVLQPVGGKPADINGDNEVNAVDIQLVVNGALNVPVAYNTDVNGDAKTDAVDIQLVVNAVLGN